MDAFKEIRPLRAYLSKHPNRSIGLVPTMGALHNGHLRLIGRSKAENDLTVCSIYVNPTQFNNASDLEKYPRTMEADRKKLEEAGCDVLFCPDNNEMYAEDPTLTFQFKGPLATTLEGAFRPGHFNGVALVVAKLFNIVCPQRAYFGLKDYQQWLVVNQLVRDLKFDIALCGVPIVREADGLAMSSRNLRLSSDERVRALSLIQCLRLMQGKLLNGATPGQARKEAADFCSSAGVKLEYAEVADPVTLLPLDQNADPRKGILLIAAQVGAIRLIDNLFVDETQAPN